MGLIRLLIYAALFWLLYRLVKSLKGGGPRVRGPHGPQNPPGGRLEGGELVQDPQCGVYIPKEGAVKGPGGHYFCSAACRDAYAAGKH